MGGTTDRRRRARSTRSEFGALELRNPRSKSVFEIRAFDQASSCLPLLSHLLIRSLPFIHTKQSNQSFIYRYCYISIRTQLSQSASNSPRRDDYYSNRRNSTSERPRCRKESLRHRLQACSFRGQCYRRLLSSAARPVDFKHSKSLYTQDEPWTKLTMYRLFPKSRAHFIRYPTWVGIPVYTSWQGRHAPAPCTIIWLATAF